MADRAQLELWLADAEKKYHAIMTGGLIKTFVDQNGERVEYSAANANRLSAYINELKRQLGLLTTNGPLNVWM